MKLTTLWYPPFSAGIRKFVDCPKPTVAMDMQIKRDEPA
jgi:hypothetical protein